MKTHTRFIAKLKAKDKKQLKDLVDHSESSRVRNRAKAILLSAQEKHATDITEFFQVSHNTIYAWFDRWKNDRFEGIADQPRSGAPSQLSDSEKEIVLELLKKHPHSPKLVLAEVSSRLGKTISEWILRQIAIAAGMSWKRMRKSLKSKQNKKKFKAAKREINKLASQHQSGKIDLVFFLTKLAFL